MQLDRHRRFGSYEHYNRVLYGGHSHDDSEGRFFTFAGDTPLFMGAESDYTKDTWCYQAKQGILMSGIALTPGHVEAGPHDLFSQWFHESCDVVSTWRHGYMSYELTQLSSWCSSLRVKMDVYPLQQDDGFLVTYEITTGQRMLFCAGFGGITPFFGRFEYHVSPGRELCLGDCAGNCAKVGKNIATITGPKEVTMTIASDFDAEFSTDSAAAMLEKYPSMFLTKHQEDAEIVKIVREILPQQTFTGKLVVLRNATQETVDKYLNDKEIGQKIRGEIRKKYAAVTFATPDETLNDSVKDVSIALDASFHGKTFYHGATGYHAPFLGWRGWYAPALLGWKERVKSAIISHFNTITRAAGEEKVWWDGADRPDLDHEGTQYSHLQNSSGHLTALLHRDDIYDMQEVAVDMTLYYLETTRDLETAAEIYDRLVEVLDWEERILAPDGNGLYQNFLNTWISDGHSYNGAKCAQASSYNYSANVRTARIGKLLGKDVSRLEARANKIQAAFQKVLWQEKSGVVAESVDTLGNKLVHAMPELSTIYLAGDCGNVDFFQNYRQLRYAETAIPQETTLLRKGKLFYSSNWQPKKYSTCGLFPAENAALALCYFQNGQAEKAHEILRAFADAFDLSPYCGSITHVLSAQGGTDDGDIDFTDVSSTYLRLLIEGLWGVRIDLVKGEVRFTPQLPDDWRDAHLELPSASVSLHREKLVDNFVFAAQAGAEKRIRLPLRYAEVDQIFVNGAQIPYAIVPGIGKAFAEFSVDAAKADVKVYYRPVEYPKLAQSKITTYAGNVHDIAVSGGAIEEIIDWSNALVRIGDSTVKVADKTGQNDLLVKVSNGSVACFLPLALDIRQIVEKKVVAPFTESQMVDLAPYFNASLTTIHDQKFTSPRPQTYSIGMRLNGRYAWEWNHFGHNALVVDDALLRNAHGKLTTPSGIDFATPETGNNAVTVSLWENFPTKIEIPLTGKARELDLLLCGTTHAMQSGVVNAKITIVYADQSIRVVELRPPFNFDDFLVGAFQTQNETLYFSAGTHGMIQKIELDPQKELKTLSLEAVANEVILNCLAATLRK